MRGRQWSVKKCRNGTSDRVSQPRDFPASVAEPARRPAAPGGVRQGAGRAAAFAAADPGGAQFDCWIMRPAVACVGRAFIGYRRANTSICRGDRPTGCCSTTQRTPSVQGGVVRDPMYVK